MDLPFDALPEESRIPKLRLLEEVGIKNAHFSLTKEDALPLQLLLACRVYHMDDVELYFAHSIGISALESVSTLVSPQNELRTLIYLTKAVAQVADQDLRVSFSLKLNQLIAAYQSHVPVSPGQSLSDAQSEALQQWADRNQVLSHVSLADFADTGRGMALKCAVEANKPVIECDAGLFLSYFSALNSAVLGPIFKELDLDEDSTLILFVIYEKFGNPKSFWRAYLDLLPASVDSALYFDDADLAFAVGTMLEMEVTMTVDHLKTTYDDIVARLGPHKQHFPPEVLNWHNYRWARAMFDSRGFNLTLRGKARNCLLPYIDSINTTHYSHLQSRGYIDESRKSESSDLGTFVLPSLGSLTSVGSQVFLNYGGFSTRELVLFYGFAYEEDNPYDLYNLSLDLPEDDYAAERMALASKVGVSNEHYLRARSVSVDLIYYLSIVILHEIDVSRSLQLDSTSLKALLTTPQQLTSVKDSLTALLEALIENLVSSNEYLSSKSTPAFPTNRARLAYRYALSQLNILQKSLQLVTKWKHS